MKARIILASMLVAGLAVVFATEAQEVPGRSAVVDVAKVKDDLRLREQILAQLRATLALQVNAAQLARDEAISEESRAENRYDTHSLEAGYLAEGQARQAGDIEEGIKALSALPLPGLPSPRLTFAGRLRGDKAPDVLVEALALMPAPPIPGR